MVVFGKREIFYSGDRIIDYIIYYMYYNIIV